MEAIYIEDCDEKLSLTSGTVSPKLDTCIILNICQMQISVVGFDG
jgi:hypothetical protein